MFLAGPPFDEQLYSVRPDGSDLRHVPDGIGDHGAPSFSPDGSQIAFARVYGHLYTVNHTVNADDTNLTDLGVNASHAEWSPDGTKIVYDNWGFTNDSDIFVYDLVTNEPHQITFRQPGEAYYRASWSPDGQQLVVNKRSADGDWDVWTVNIDGTNYKNLTEAWTSSSEAAPEIRSFISDAPTIGTGVEGQPKAVAVPPSSSAA